MKLSSSAKKEHISKVDTSKYGIKLRIQPKFKFSKGHECYGCIFVSGTKDDGLAPPCVNRKNCLYAFYQKQNQKTKNN